MMKISLQGRVVLVTGASSGIGALTARLLAERGAIPVLAARSADKLAELSGSIRSEHAVFEMDVRREDEVNAVVAETHRRYGRIDVLLNNAGYGEFVPFAEATLEHFQDMMDVNYMGVVRCSKAVLPYMLKAGQGHIVNIASIAGKIGTAKSSGYSASKHAVIGLTGALRHELRKSGILVSAVNPGPIDTPFFNRADPDGSYVKNVGWFMMKPGKVARAIVSVIERRKAEVDLPWLAATGVRINRLFPRWTDSIVGKMLDKK